jgi:alpha-1,6-mannosyltransferase
MILSGRRMLRLLDDVQPDRIEVSDSLTLQAVGRWAQRRAVARMHAERLPCGRWWTAC